MRRFVPPYDQYAAAPPLMAPTAAPAAPQGRGGASRPPIHVDLTLQIATQATDTKGLAEEIMRIAGEKLNTMFEGVAIQLAAEVST